MKRITDRNTPAHLAALKFMRGVNLGNSLEYAAGNSAGGLQYSSEDFRLIREEGFDHVRIPVAWHLYTGASPQFTISSTIFTRLDALVNLASARGLAVLIDLHHFDAFTSDPNGNTPKLQAIWRQVAEHYVNSPATIAFELLNEPRDAATTAVMNRIYPEVIRQIRQISPNRTILVGPGNFNSADELQIPSGTGLLLPNDDLNVIATVHIYDPYYFTHQGAEWALPDTSTTGVIFPGPPATAVKPNSSVPTSHTWVYDWFDKYSRYPANLNPSGPAAFQGKLSRLKSWSEYFGRPVYIGEFGCYEKADAISRVNFYREMRRSIDAQGLGWAMWDWKAGFHYIKSGRPDPAGMREAMFPSIELRSSGRGSVEFDGAVGKTYVIERTFSLVPPVTWSPVMTRVLTSPVFTFSDSDAGTQGGAFYRVQWQK